MNWASPHSIQTHTHIRSFAVCLVCVYVPKRNRNENHRGYPKWQEKYSFSTINLCLWAPFLFFCVFSVQCAIRAVCWFSYLQRAAWAYIYIVHILQALDILGLKLYVFSVLKFISCIFFFVFLRCFDFIVTYFSRIRYFILQNWSNSVAHLLMRCKMDCVVMQSNEKFDLKTKHFSHRKKNVQTHE